jgi:hypothetical protein
MLMNLLDSADHSLFKLDDALALLGVGNRLSRNSMMPELSAQTESYVRLYCESLNEAREHHRDQVSLKSLWLFLNKLRWQYSSDLFEKLKDDDVIEVYSMEHTQIFRSYMFFKYCSYTLDKLYSKPWFDLYHREASVQKEAFQWLEKFLMGELKGVSRLELPIHWLSELASTDPYHLKLKYDWVGVLTDQYGQTAGYVISSRILSSCRGADRSLPL